MQHVGGLLGAFDIWEAAIVLEELQNMFMRLTLDTPVTTGKPALLWETGSISMEMRVVKRKLNLLKGKTVKLKSHEVN